jgi:hypothetical protein
VAFNVLHRLVLGTGRTCDQYCTGGTDCLNDCPKKVLILGAVPTAARIGLAMNMPRRVLRMNLLALHLVRIAVLPYDAEHGRALVVRLFRAPVFYLVREGIALVIVTVPNRAHVKVVPRD